MISEEAIRKWRESEEAGARKAAENGRFSLWGAYIHDINMLDVILQDDGPSAGERIPFDTSQEAVLQRLLAQR